jgi:hypothetical protein
MKGLILTLGLLFITHLALSSGHGPVFGLATPTLGKGHASFDFAIMSNRQSGGSALMLKYLWGYGITENLQIALSTHTPIEAVPLPTRTRGSLMMQANGDIEGLVLWRFHRDDYDIGNRLETTMIVSGSIPTEKKRGGVAVGNALHAALVTGYASRITYLWVGGGYQHYLKKGNDQLGGLWYGSFVFGWRPPLFREDYPKPDWRLFIESLAEFPGRNTINGVEDPNSGGSRVLVGPTVLGLYGDWGISGGVLFPIQQKLNGNQPSEKARVMITLTYWI